MAIQRVKENFKKLMNTIDESALRDNSANKHAHFITLTDKESAAAFAKGTRALFLKRGYTKAEIKEIDNIVGGLKNSYATTIRRYYSEIISTATRVGTTSTAPFIVLQPKATVFPGNLPGVYVGTRSTSSRITFITLSIERDSRRAPGKKAGSTLLDGVSRSLRRAVWERWFDNNLPLFQEYLRKLQVERAMSAMSGAPTTTIGPMYKRMTGAEKQRFGTATPFAHEEGSTVGTEWLRELTDKASHYQDDTDMETINAQGIYFSVADYIKNYYEIDWTETTFLDPRTGLINKQRKVSGTIDARNFPGSEETDTVNLKKFGEEVLKDVLDNNRHAWGAGEGKNATQQQADEYDASPTFRDTSIEGAKYVLTLPLTKKGKLDKRFKEVQNFIKAQKPKKTGPRNAKQSGKKGSALKTASFASAALMGAVKSKRPTNRRKPKGEFNLAKVQALINKGLADTIKQNMGRPALINRTGRFADSAQVVSMKPSQAGVSANYTYQLNPYETFENTGQIEWPAGYNPKPLIAKSIRQLAGQYLQTKLTVRRV